MNSKELPAEFQAEPWIRGAPTCEELGSHVDGGAHDAARHHRLGFAEAQIRDFGPVLFVQLRKKKGRAGAGEKPVSPRKHRFLVSKQG